MNPSRNPSSHTMTRLWLFRAAGAYLVVLGVASSGWAQGFGPDPFKPYNSRFDPFVYPVAPGPLDYGNNQGYTGPERGGVRGANQFENYLNSLRGGGNARTGGGTGSGAGTPYYRSHRSFDPEYDKFDQYRPNRLADEKYETNQEEVGRLYFKYLRAKDPKKRAEIFRDYNKARNQADRELSSSPGAKSKGTRPNRREGSAARAEAGPASGARAAGAPPALGTEGTRSDRSAGAPPPTGAEGTRSDRARSGGSRTNRGVGPAPSPLEDEEPTIDAPRPVSPSRVLDRALRTDPLRRAPRPRLSAPSGLGPAPPP
jgi:hypothetical protein